MFGLSQHVSIGRRSGPSSRARRALEHLPVRRVHRRECLRRHRAASDELGVRSRSAFFDRSRYGPQRILYCHGTSRHVRSMRCGCPRSALIRTWDGAGARFVTPNELSVRPSAARVARQVAEPLLHLRSRSHVVRERAAARRAVPPLDDQVPERADTRGLPRARGARILAGTNRCNTAPACLAPTTSQPGLSADRHQPAIETTPREPLHDRSAELASPKCAAPPLHTRRAVGNVTSAAPPTVAPIRGRFCAAPPAQRARRARLIVRARQEVAPLAHESGTRA